MTRTACKNCKHLFQTGTSVSNKPIWYHNLCKAVETKKVFDPLYGEDRHIGNKYAYCSDVNKGNCPYYQEK